jgi:hypothetical protein
VNIEDPKVIAKIADLGEASLFFAATKREQVDNPSI